MLADVCHLDHVGVESGSCGGLAEGRLVHSRRAGAYHHAVKEVILYRVYDEGLTALGTHVLVILCKYNARLAFHSLSNRVNINGRGDV